MLTVKTQIGLGRCLVLPKQFLNFQTPKIFAVSYLKFKQIGQTLDYFCQNGGKGIAKSEDPDQTAPLI